MEISLKLEFVPYGVKLWMNNYFSDKHEHFNENIDWEQK